MSTPRVPLPGEVVYDEEAFVEGKNNRNRAKKNKLRKNRAASKRARKARKKARR